MSIIYCRYMSAREEFENPDICGRIFIYLVDDTQEAFLLAPLATLSSRLTFSCQSHHILKKTISKVFMN